MDTEKCEFAVMLIAHTQKCIILPHKEEGGKVNIEVDVISKYVGATCFYSVALSAPFLLLLPTNWWPEGGEGGGGGDGGWGDGGGEGGGGDGG